MSVAVSRPREPAYCFFCARIQAINAPSSSSLPVVTDGRGEVVR